LTQDAAPDSESRTSRHLRIPSFPRSRAILQPLGVVVAVILVVGGLLVGLPVKEVAGQQAATYVPLDPQADSFKGQTDVGLDAPFQVTFTKPMNAPSVEAALAIVPAAQYRTRWDATDQILSVLPDPHWEAETQYRVVVSAEAKDLEGLSLSTPIDTTFTTGGLTSGVIAATQMVGDLASPRTAFQLTFTRSVKLSTVLSRLGFIPSLEVNVVGDDPTDMASTVFTITPKATLQTDTGYRLSFADGGTDVSGSPIQPVESLVVHTLSTPAIVAFTPQEGAVTRDTRQIVTIQFSTEMDVKATTQAMRITSNGATVYGTTRWSDDGTTVTWTPNKAFAVGASVVVSVAATARSAGGVEVKGAASNKFSVAVPRSRSIVYTGTTTPIKWTGGAASTSSPWYASEVYYLALMNCTRTGGWVVSGGLCSTATHHTKPPQKALSLDAGISNKVARPYAEYMADRCVLNHYLIGTPHSRLASQGYPSGSWGENIASPTTYQAGGMVAVETYFQGEYWMRGNTHYTNIMNKYFHRAGIGLWVSNCTRLVIDFYG
jgi:hypothetical protein